MNTAAVTRGSSTQHIDKQWKSSVHKPSGESAEESAKFSGVLKQYLESPQADQAQVHAKVQSHTQENETKSTTRQSESALSDAHEDCDCSADTVPSAIIQSVALNIPLPGDTALAHSKTVLHSVTEEGLIQGRCEAEPEHAPIPPSSSGSRLASEPAPGALPADGMATAASDAVLTGALQAGVTKNETEPLHPAENFITEKAHQSSETDNRASDSLKEAKKGEAALTLASGKAQEDHEMLKALMAEAKKSFEHESQAQPKEHKNSFASASAKNQPGEVTSSLKNSADLAHSSESVGHNLAAKVARPEMSDQNIRTNPTEAALLTHSLAGSVSENGETIMTLPGTVHISALPELLAEQAQLIKAGETNTLRLHLNPEQLGSLEIELSLKNGILTGVISVESELAHELLQKQLPQLLSTLDSKQIPTGTFEMHYRGENGGFSNHADQGREPHQGAYQGTYHVKEAETAMAHGAHVAHGAHASAEPDAHKRLDLLA